MLKSIKRFIVEHTLPFKEIVYFHPDGKQMPNGICYQKGGFCRECRENEQKFHIYNDQGNTIEQAHNKGFVIVFPQHREVTTTNRKYFHGNFFEGRYVDADEEMYGKTSVCIYIDDMELCQTLKYAMSIASDNGIQHAIVKDFETNRIYRGNI